MKETKVYVDKMPESCKSCQFQCYGECRNGCDILKTDYSMTQCHIMRGKHTDCPLIDIKDHDRELVKEVCEKIRDVCKLNIRTYKKHLPEDCNKYKEIDAFNKAILGVLEFLDQIQKEYEK